MKKRGFNELEHSPVNIESVVLWCEHIKKQHPWYDTVDLMVWAFEKGVIAERNVRSKP